MPTTRFKLLTILTAGFVIPAVIAPSIVEASSGRQSMEQCVSRVLTRLTRARAPEAQVGPTVLSECDGPLRATLAEAIRTGEAGLCTVESCIGMARSRAAEEATEAYRQRARP